MRRDRRVPCEAGRRYLARLAARLCLGWLAVAWYHQWGVAERVGGPQNGCRKVLVCFTACFFIRPCWLGG